MADTLTRQSPLQTYADRFAEMPESAAVQEEPFVSAADLWVDASGPGGVAASAALGVPTLPSAPSTILEGTDTAIIWFGPDEWLVTSGDRTPEALESKLRVAVSEHGGAAVDVSAQRTTVRLRGARARDVLAKGCSLDLHPSVLGPGSATQTMLGQAAVVVIPLSHTGTDYRILVRSSFARYLAEWLIDAAEEFAAKG